MSRGSLALLFPGQGSQDVGMGRDVYETSAAARRVFELADDALGFSLTKLCFEGPEEDLLRTDLQQPAILTTSIALLRALEEQGDLEPTYVAGHSLGEYTALVACGALDFEDAVRLVHARGRFMQEAVPIGRGAMAAVIGLAVNEVEDACAWARADTGREVIPANYNSPLQTVVSGDAVAVEIACSRAKKAGARRTVPLEVSAPFHSPLMAPAAGKLQLELSRVIFNDASLPVVSNVSAEPASRASEFADLLFHQMTAPVRFTSMVARMVELGVGRTLEIGPGRVLSGLVARCAKGVDRANLGRSEDLTAAAEFAGSDS